MNITPSILQDEFIGLRAKVVQSSNPGQIGISGIILDETQQTLKIFDGQKEKVVPKTTSVFHFTLHDGSLIEVEGKVIVGRPEDRAKRIVRRGW